ncbi:MAG: peroxiredoxin, partial [Akkermansiaceae bacterium]|nr:peroxiredoxin [Akkermansiaceae bacterium]
PEAFNISVPAGDPWFDPQGTGAVEIPLNRSFYEMVDGVRQQVNAITAYIDASNVYGSDAARADALRTNDGSGKLRTSPSPHGDLLPYNDGPVAFPNAPSPDPGFFLAGDVRANEQAGLTAMHTLFVREHNYWAEQFARLNPGADGDDCYQFARMIVGAEMQAITYREFLPVLLGRGALPPYRGYRPKVNAGVANVFSTGAYRLGHSLLSPTLLRLDRAGRAIAAGHLPLAAAFFHPPNIEDEGIDPLLRGLAAQRCQELDMMLVDDVRNMLFGKPGSGGMDLAALNIQRGRDHGLPPYTAVCESMGLPMAHDFHDINPDPAVWQRLAAAYEHVGDIDCWVGGLCEPHAPGSMTGPMVRAVLVDQFTRLRDGDRFYYKNRLSPRMARFIEQQTLARIIRRNTGIGRELSDNVFMIRKPKGPRDRPVAEKHRRKHKSGKPGGRP